MECEACVHAFKSTCIGGLSHCEQKRDEITLLEKMENEQMA